jgi:hypothetical protein
MSMPRQAPHPPTFNFALEQQTAAAFMVAPQAQS